MRAAAWTAGLLTAVVVGILLEVCGASAANFKIDWLKMASVAYESPVPNASVFNLPGVGNVTLTYSIPATFTQSRQTPVACLQNGSLGGGAHTFSWTTHESFALVSGAAPTNPLVPDPVSVTYSFPSEIPAGSLYLGVIGLGSEETNGGGETIATVFNAGANLGDWDDGTCTFAPTGTAFTGYAGSFELKNSVSTSWNTNLNVVMITQPVTSLTVNLSQLPADGVGVNIGYVAPASNDTCPVPTAVHYSFDDPTNRGKDSSGNLNPIDGVLGAASPVAGKCGSALRFRPNNNVQEFSVPSVPALNMTDAMTGSAWIKIRGSQSTDFDPGCTEGTIFAKGGSNWFQVERNNNRLVFQNEPSGDESAVANYPFQLGEWTQVGFVRGAPSAGGQTIQLYVNCVSVETIVYENGVSTGTNILHSPAYANSDPLMVGNYGYGSSPAACEFNGDIDELRLFDRALTSDQVVELCNCPCSADPILPCATPDSIVINTGWDQEAGSLLAEGAPDNEWKVTPDPISPNAVFQPAYVMPPYAPTLCVLAAGASSRWITPYPPGAAPLRNYVYEYRFCLEDSLGASLDLNVCACEHAQIYLNGRQIGFVVVGGCLFMSTNAPTDFRAGTNVLTVKIQGPPPSYGPPGLEVEGAVHGHVPQAAYCCSDTTATLLGTVWMDANRNGSIDGGETKLAGWTVNLSNGMSTTTDAYGNYCFNGLASGTYTVTQSPPTYPVIQVIPPAPPTTYTVVLDRGEVQDQLNFGEYDVFTTAGVGPPEPAALMLKPLRPNPIPEHDLNIAFNLPVASLAFLDLVDVSGRRLARREVGSLGSGWHTVHLEADRKVAPGIYWVRLTQGANHRAVRAVVIE